MTHKEAQKKYTSTPKGRERTRLAMERFNRKHGVKPLEEKKCIICGATFKQTQIRQTICKSEKCERERKRIKAHEWRIKNPERSRTNDRNFYYRNHEHRLELKKQWRDKNQEKVIAIRLKSRFRICDKELVNRLLISQNNECSICKVKFTRMEEKDYKKINAPHIDHDHKTGQIRGLLCGNCNTGLGLFKDNPNHLLNAIAYIEAHEKAKNNP